MSKRYLTTAAWRLSIWSTLAFALGTSLAFFLVYLLVAQSVRMRTDAWLTGEVEVLAQVSANTPQDRLYNRIVREVAELATQELPEQRNDQGQNLISVFFLLDPKNHQNPLWVGPTAQEPFLDAIRRSTLMPSTPQTIRVEGWRSPFRVVRVSQNGGGNTVYLGLSTRGDAKLLYSLTLRLLMIWGGTVFLGFLISYLSARRTLNRVERITETVARIGSEGFEERLPEPMNADEISKLAKTFNRMLDRVQSSVNQLRSVTDAVAHDVKSPVTSIRGVLESALSDNSEDRWRDSVAESIEGLDRLLDLLNTVLDLAEAQGGALRLDRGPVDLTEAVRKLVDLYHLAIANNHHELITDLEPQVVVNADLHLLNRVISNLLENEMTHLPAGCQIKIRLRCRREIAELAVEDNGPGFPPEIADRVFERFVKGKNSSGHGLGLAFVDAVIQAHGGTVRITDRVEGGAIIILSLPAHPSQQPSYTGNRISSS